MTDNSPPAPRRPDPSRRNPRSQRAIFEASLELVGEVGYAGLTIEAIAARAGVGKQTIYRWWPSKAAVLLDAFLAAGGDPRPGEGHPQTALPDTGDIEADLKAVLRATVDEFNDPAFEAPYRALAIAGAGDAELSSQFTSRLSEPARQAYRERLRAAVDAGEIAPDADLDIAAEMILGPFFARWLSRAAPLDHNFTDRLVEHALRGLRPRS